MSVSAELWKAATAARVANSECLPAAKSEVVVDSGLRDPLALLVRQVFLPTLTLKRRHVLFLAADEEERAVDLCEQAALVLADLSGARVAVVGGRALPAIGRKPPHSVAEAGLWRTYSFALSDRVWRLPALLFCDRLAHENSEQRRPTAEFRSVFEYFLFASRSGGGELPVFSSLCDAAVLVVSANRTRKDSAIHAKEQLARYKLPLLGAVLTERVLEIPDAIYRRL